MAGEYYRADREAVAPESADAPASAGAEADTSGSHDEGCPAHDAEHGPNGFDLHALSGNLCRCTGYRPIRDAAYTLGFPEASDPLAAARVLAWPETARLSFWY